MIEFKNVSFSYNTVNPDGENVPVTGLSSLNLTIKTGEFLVLTGSSGCGKTTAIRLINGLIPHYYKGELTGTVTMDGENVSEKPIYETARKVGSVFQNPRSQFFNVNTTDEIAFAAENQKVESQIIKERIAQTANEMQIEKLLNRSIFELSGGEKQIIACAGINVLSPEVVVLDEPSSNLDISAIERLKKALGDWKAEGKTIIIAEHRLYFLRELADRMLIFEDGVVKKELSREEILNLSPRDTAQLGIRPLTLSGLSKADVGGNAGVSTSGNADTYAETGADANKLTKPLTNGPKAECYASAEAASKANLELVFEGFDFRYPTGDHGISISELNVPKGKVTAIVGRNGAGKSTFVRNICGLEKKCKGILKLDGKKMKAKDRLHSCYMVMQDVNHQLFTESVKDEVLLSISDRKLSEEEKEKISLSVLEGMDLSKYAETHPMALSGGQKQRTAIAAGISSKKPILILDEPTSGLDFHHMQQVAAEIIKLRDMGKTIFVVTHDLEFILACCDYLVHLEDGKVTESYTLTRESAGRLASVFAS